MLETLYMLRVLQLDETEPLTESCLYSSFAQRRMLYTDMLQDLIMIMVPADLQIQPAVQI